MTPTPETLVVEFGPAFTVRLPGGEWFQPAGKHGRGGVIPRLARKLVADGVDPATPIRAMRGDTQIWKYDQPLSYWAGFSASEPDGSSVKMVRYTAMPSYWNKDTLDAEAHDEDSDQEAELDDALAADAT